MNDASESCGKTNREGGRAAQPGTERYLALDSYLHGDNADIFHHNTVEVEEADDAGYSEAWLCSLEEKISLYV